MATWLENAVSTVLGLANTTNAPSSNYGSLNPNLIANFTQCDKDGAPIDGGASFKAAVKEGSVEQSFNWASPFENMSAESEKMSLMGLAQTGGIADLSQALGLIGESSEEKNSDNKFQAFSDAVEGRSGITKLNSTQVYSGHSPLKVSMTLIFRAWQDPQSEVAAPYQALLKMAYPAELAETALHSASDAVKNSDESGSMSDVAKNVGYATFFPSLAPKYVKLSYKGETYPPMVIESISKPLDAPYSPMGDIFLEVQVSLQSLRSMDFADISKMSTTAASSTISSAINESTKLFKSNTNSYDESLFKGTSVFD